MTLTNLLAARRWWELENQREATTVYLAPGDSEVMAEEVRALFIRPTSAGSAEVGALIWKVDESLAPNEVRFAEERTPVV